MKTMLLTTDTEAHWYFRKLVDRVWPWGEVDEGLASDRAWRVREVKPDVVIVYGTEKLGDDVLAGCPVIWNLHGGDPERYRGLDGHLWAIYHRDWGAIQATLHEVVAELDAGGILDRRQVVVEDKAKLTDLPIRTAAVCADMVIEALGRFGRVQAVAQKDRGRYYGRMPEALRPVCERHWRERFG